MKDAVLVTLVDKKFIKYAKQFFASAFFNAGWRGDYLLLAYQVPERDLIWFKKKGILIKKCKPFTKKKIAYTQSAILSKYYLFTEYFCKWKIIIYYDVDVIVRSPLEKLLKVKDFTAVKNCNNTDFNFEIISSEDADKKGVDEIRKKFIVEYNLDQVTFGAGMMVINTRIINTLISKKLEELIQTYCAIGTNVDQFILNLYFYKRWKSLSSVYDIYIINNKNQWNLESNKIPGIAIHFPGKLKPWNKQNLYYKEWLNNQRRAEKIDLNHIPKKNGWSWGKIIWNSLYLDCRFYFVTRIAKNQKLNKGYYIVLDNYSKLYYFIVHYVEKKYPKLFIFLKITKKRIKNKYNL